MFLYSCFNCSVYLMKKDFLKKKVNKHINFYCPFCGYVHSKQFLERQKNKKS